MPKKPHCCRSKSLSPAMRRTAEISSALSDGNRLRIVCMLREGERCVCDIWQFLGLSQNLASHHLKALKDAGLIASRKDGLKVIYSLDRKAFSGYIKGLERHVRESCPSTSKTISVIK